MFYVETTFSSALSLNAGRTKQERNKKMAPRCMSPQESGTRLFLKTLSPGWSTLLATTCLGDELGECHDYKEYDDSEGCRIVVERLLKRERSAIGIHRTWFDISAFDKLVDEDIHAALQVVDFFYDCDVGIHSAAYECELDEEEIEEGLAYIQMLRQEGV